VAPPPLLLRVYAGLADLAAPLLYSRVAKRLAGQSVSSARIAERRGSATRLRPDGPLIWFHGASVGETLSILPLVQVLRAERPDIHILVTSVTATSAEILAKRLPKDVIHQFAPIDTRAALRRFHTHWSPDLLVLVESEIWPQTIRSCRERDVPVVLLNARLSAKSLDNWRKLGSASRWLFSQFSLIIAQTAETAAKLEALGAPRVRVGANLKAAAPPPPDDPVARRSLTDALNGRPVWLAASTHEGEEAAILDAHVTLRAKHADLCLILAPRHPNRASDIMQLARDRGLTVSRRSAGVAGVGAVYLADTIGDMGLLYRLSPITLLAGSFVPVGGHNPWEAACGTAILHGPLVANSQADYDKLDAAGGSIAVTADDLSVKVSHLLGSPDTARKMATAAEDCKAAQSDGTADLVDDLVALMERRTR